MVLTWIEKLVEKKRVGEI